MALSVLDSVMEKAQVKLVKISTAIFIELLKYTTYVEWYSVDCRPVLFCLNIRLSDTEITHISFNCDN